MQTAIDKGLADSLAEATLEAYRKAIIQLPPDVLRAIVRAEEAETDPVACGEYANIRKNIDLAQRLVIPLCQDTGIQSLPISL